MMWAIPIDKPENSTDCSLARLGAEAGAVTCMADGKLKLLGYDLKCIGCPIIEVDIEAMQKVVDAARSRCECPIGRTNCDRDETMCDVIDLCIALTKLDAKEAKE